MKDIGLSSVVIEDANDTELKENVVNTVTFASDSFPVMQFQNEQLSSYLRVPLASLAALGAAFSQFPEEARTLTHSVTRMVATDTPLFVGIWPKDVYGTMIDKGLGFSGNIVGTTSKGNSGIVGRMRYKLLDTGLPVNETASVVMPPDPTLIIVAIALMTIEKKLDGIQESVEDVLRLIKQEKQSRQRGNLNMLAEIMEDYKTNCQNEKFCMSRVNEVLSIKTMALQDIDYYQTQISEELKKQKGIHSSKKSQSLLEAIMYQFAEYQLACHIYAFSTYLDAMLRMRFENIELESIVEKIQKQAQRYEALFVECRAQIAGYQRSTIEAQIVGNMGIATQKIGKAIAAIPIIREGPVDELLIEAGESIGKHNQKNVRKQIKTFEFFEENPMSIFIDNLNTIKLLYTTQNAMVTDGSDLYVLQQ